MSEVKIESTIKGLGSILYCDEAFDDALEALNSKGASIISASDLAYARIQRGANHSLSKNGSYVKEGILYLPYSDTKRVLLRNSLVLLHPFSAFSYHDINEEYFIKDDLNVNAFLEHTPFGSEFNVNTFLRSVHADDHFDLDDLSPIPTDRFGEDARTVWLFGKNAKDYGLFLQDKGKTKQIEFHTNNDTYIKSQKQEYANQLWLGRSDYNSDIDFHGRNLNGSNRVRGLKLIDENKIKKITIPSLDDVLKYSKDFVPKDSWNDFTNGLREKYSGGN